MSDKNSEVSVCSSLVEDENYRSSHQDGDSVCSSRAKGDHLEDKRVCNSPAEGNSDCSQMGYHFDSAIRADYSQDSLKYNTLSRGKQSLTNCYAFIIHGFIKRLQSLNKDDLHLILDAGDLIYNKLGFADQTYKKLLEIKGFPFWWKAQSYLYYVSCRLHTSYKGYMHRESCSADGNSLNAGLNLLFAKKANCILVIHSAAFGIKEFTGVYYVFDPHSRGPNALCSSDSNGQCVLTVFNTFARLCDFLQELAKSMSSVPLEQVPVVLHEVEIFKVDCKRKDTSSVYFYQEGSWLPCANKSQIRQASCSIAFPQEKMKDGVKTPLRLGCKTPGNRQEKLVINFKENIAEVNSTGKNNTDNDPNVKGQASPVLCMSCDSEDTEGNGEVKYNSTMEGEPEGAKCNRKQKCKFTTQGEPESIESDKESKCISARQGELEGTESDTEWKCKSTRQGKPEGAESDREQKCESTRQGEPEGTESDREWKFKSTREGEPEGTESDRKRKCSSDTQGEPESTEIDRKRKCSSTMQGEQKGTSDRERNFTKHADLEENLNGCLALRDTCDENSESSAVCTNLIADEIKCKTSDSENTASDNEDKPGLTSQKKSTEDILEENSKGTNTDENGRRKSIKIVDFLTDQSKHRCFTEDTHSGEEEQEEDLEESSDPISFNFEINGRSVKSLTSWVDRSKFQSYDSESTISCDSTYQEEPEENLEDELHDMDKAAIGEINNITPKQEPMDEDIPTVNADAQKKIGFPDILKPEKIIPLKDIPTVNADAQKKIAGILDILKPEKIIPLKERKYDANKHCGVFAGGEICTRSLTCKDHALSLRRAVPGRKLPFDELLQNHRNAKQDYLVAKELSKRAAAASIKVWPFNKSSNSVTAKCSEESKERPVSLFTQDKVQSPQRLATPTQDTIQEADIRNLEMHSVTDSDNNQDDREQLGHATFRITQNEANKNYELKKSSLKEAFCTELPFELKANISDKNTVDDEISVKDRLLHKLIKFSQIMVSENEVQTNLVNDTVANAIVAKMFNDGSKKGVCEIEPFVEIQASSSDKDFVVSQVQEPDSENQVPAPVVTEKVPITMESQAPLVTDGRETLTSNPVKRMGSFKMGNNSSGVKSCSRNSNEFELKHFGSKKMTVVSPNVLPDTPLQNTATNRDTPVVDVQFSEGLQPIPQQFKPILPDISQKNLLHPVSSMFQSSPSSAVTDIAKGNTCMGNIPYTVVSCAESSNSLPKTTAAYGGTEKTIPLNNIAMNISSFSLKNTMEMSPQTVARISQPTVVSPYMIQMNTPVLNQQLYVVQTNPQMPSIAINTPLGQVNPVVGAMCNMVMPQPLCVNLGFNSNLSNQVITNLQPNSRQSVLSNQVITNLQPSFGQSVLSNQVVTNLQPNSRQSLLSSRVATNLQPNYRQSLLSSQVVTNLQPNSGQSVLSNQVVTNLQPNSGQSVLSSQVLRNPQHNSRQSLLSNQVVTNLQPNSGQSVSSSQVVTNLQPNSEQSVLSSQVVTNLQPNSEKSMFSNQAVTNPQPISGQSVLVAQRNVLAVTSALSNQIASNHLSNSGSKNIVPFSDAKYHSGSKELPALSDLLAKAVNNQHGRKQSVTVTCNTQKKTLSQSCAQPVMYVKKLDTVSTDVPSPVLLVANINNPHNMLLPVPISASRSVPLQKDPVPNVVSKPAVLGSMNNAVSTTGNALRMTLPAPVTSASAQGLKDFLSNAQLLEVPVANTRNTVQMAFPKVLVSKTNVHEQKHLLPNATIPAVFSNSTFRPTPILTLEGVQRSRKVCSSNTPFKPAILQHPLNSSPEVPQKQVQIRKTARDLLTQRKMKSGLSDSYPQKIAISRFPPAITPMVVVRKKGPPADKAFSQTVAQSRSEFESSTARQFQGQLSKQSKTIQLSKQSKTIVVIPPDKAKADKTETLASMPKVYFDSPEKMSSTEDSASHKASFRTEQVDQITNAGLTTKQFTHCLISRNQMVNQFTDNFSTETRYRTQTPVGNVIVKTIIKNPESVRGNVSGTPKPGSIGGYVAGTLQRTRTVGGNLIFNSGTAKHETVEGNTAGPSKPTKTIGGNVIVKTGTAKGETVEDNVAGISKLPSTTGGNDIVKTGTAKAETVEGNVAGISKLPSTSGGNQNSGINMSKFVQLTIDANVFLIPSNIFSGSAFPKKGEITTPTVMHDSPKVHSSTVGAVLRKSNLQCPDLPCDSKSLEESTDKTSSASNLQCASNTLKQLCSKIGTVRKNLQGATNSPKQSSLQQQGVSILPTSTYVSGDVAVAKSESAGNFTKITFSLSKSLRENMLKCKTCRVVVNRFPIKKKTVKAKSAIHSAKLINCSNRCKKSFLKKILQHGDKLTPDKVWAKLLFEKEMVKITGPTSTAKAVVQSMQVVSVMHNGNVSSIATEVAPSSPVVTVFHRMAGTHLTNVTASNLKVTNVSASNLKEKTSPNSEMKHVEPEKQPRLRVIKVMSPTGNTTHAVGTTTPSLVGSQQISKPNVSQWLSVIKVAQSTIQSNPAEKSNTWAAVSGTNVIKLVQSTTKSTLAQQSNSRATVDGTNIIKLVQSATKLTPAQQSNTGRQSNTGGQSGNVAKLLAVKRNVDSITLDNTASVVKLPAAQISVAATSILPPTASMKSLLVASAKTKLVTTPGPQPPSVITSAYSVANSQRSTATYSLLVPPNQPSVNLPQLKTPNAVCGNSPQYIMVTTNHGNLLVPSSMFHQGGRLSNSNKVLSSGMLTQLNQLVKPTLVVPGTENGQFPATSIGKANTYNTYPTVPSTESGQFPANSISRANAYNTSLSTNATVSKSTATVQGSNIAVKSEPNTEGYGDEQPDLLPHFIVKEEPMDRGYSDEITNNQDSVPNLSSESIGFNLKRKRSECIEEFSSHAKRSNISFQNEGESQAIEGESQTGRVIEKKQNEMPFMEVETSHTEKIRRLKEKMKEKMSALDLLRKSSGLKKD